MIKLVFFAFCVLASVFLTDISGSIGEVGVFFTLINVFGKAFTVLYLPSLIVFGSIQHVRMFLARRRLKHE